MGDDCAVLSKRFSITLHDLKFLNPSIDLNCENLWLNYAYCVQPVGAIISYSSYLSTSVSSYSQYYSLTSADYATATWSVVTSPAVPTRHAFKHKPKAPGTWRNCSTYVDGIDKPPVVDQFFQKKKTIHLWGFFQLLLRGIISLWNNSQKLPEMESKLKEGLNRTLCIGFES